jgi:hypothetical protein
VPAALLASAPFLSLSVPTWIIPPDGELQGFYQNLSKLPHMQVSAYFKFFRFLIIVLPFFFFFFFFFFFYCNGEGFL